MELRITIAQCAGNSSLFARFLNSTCGQGAPPRGLHFLAPQVSSAPLQASTRIPYLPLLSPGLLGLLQGLLLATFTVRHGAFHPFPRPLYYILFQAFFDPVHFYVNVGIILSVFTKPLNMIMIWIALILKINLKKIAALKILSLLVHKRDISPFIYIFFNFPQQYLVIFSRGLACLSFSF